MKSLEVTYQGIKYRLTDLSDQMFVDITEDENKLQEHFCRCFENGRNIEIINENQEYDEILQNSTEVLQNPTPPAPKLKTTVKAPSTSKVTCKRKYARLSDVDGAESITDLENTQKIEPKSASKTPKRKYVSYRKFDTDEEQDRLDEVLVTMVMDKPQISNPKIDAALRTKEKVSLAWLDIKSVIEEDFPEVNYSVDELKGRWTSLKGAFFLRKKRPKPPSGSGGETMDPKVTQENTLDLLMAGLFDANRVKSTKSNLSLYESQKIPRLDREETETSLTDADVAPSAFHKNNKSNDVNFQFLKSFNELKDAVIRREYEGKESCDKYPSDLDPCKDVHEDKIQKFLKYLSSLLIDFSSSELEDVEFDIIRAVRDKKKELNK